jgi:putative ABC transport system substrate-binding protein
MTQQILLVKASSETEIDAAFATFVQGGAGALLVGEGGSLAGSLEALKEGLDKLGWREGETFEVDARFANGDFSIIPRLAEEIVARRLDVIVATVSSETKALQAVTRDIPIVFLQIPDPLFLGVVDSIARPGKNITGFRRVPNCLGEAT